MGYGGWVGYVGEEEGTIMLDVAGCVWVLVIWLVLAAKGRRKGWMGVLIKRGKGFFIIRGNGLGFGGLR